MADRPKRILVVDDSMMVLTVARKMLQAAGYDVLTASNLTQLEQHRGSEPDLVLVDVQMPEANGDDLAAHLKRVHGIHVPIYLMSSLDAAQLAERAAGAGIEGFIEKDAGLLTLVGRVEEILGPGVTPNDAVILPRFFEPVVPRVDRALEWLARGLRAAAPSLVTDMQQIVGEAQLLGLTEVAVLARDAERAAEVWGASGTPSDQRACEAAVRALGRRVDKAVRRARSSTGRRVTVVALREIADVMVGKLRAAGASTRVATSAAEALEAAFEQRPHTVLIDLASGIDHDTLLPRLREVAGALPMAIAVFSSTGGAHEPAGADAVLPRADGDTLAALSERAARLFA